MAEIWDLWDARCIPKPHAQLHAVAASLPDATTIAPRAWRYGTQLVRRFVTVLVAPGGMGKSALALAQCVALATGRGFLGERVRHAYPAWMLNLEDPLDELRRRLAAGCMYRGIDRASLADRLYLHSGRERRLCIARPRPVGGIIVFQDQQAVIEAARVQGVGCIMVDPFVKSHGLVENSNTDMDAAATAWAEIADATGAAIQLIHHTRKPASGVAASADVDAAPGGNALTDTARMVMLLSPMTSQEAEPLDVAETDRWRHVRLDDAKSNMAPRGTRARWYRLDTISLANGTPDYPSDDQVAAITAWAAETVRQRLTPRLCNQALDMIAAIRRGRGTDRWAGRVLMERFDLNEVQACEIITAGLKSGLLTEKSCRDPAQRRTRLGEQVIDDRRSTAMGRSG